MNNCLHPRYLPDYRTPLPMGACVDCGASVPAGVINLDTLPRTSRDRLRDVWRAVVMAWRAST